MKLTKRKNIWIQRDEDTNALTVSGAWFENYTRDEPKMTRQEAKQLFACIKEAINAKFPNLTVNPWLDAPPGTLD